jgi:hypothetical protein
MPICISTVLAYMHADIDKEGRLLIDASLACQVYSIRLTALADVNPYQDKCWTVHMPAGL